MNTLKTKYDDILTKYCQNKLKGVPQKTLRFMQEERQVKNNINHFITWLENNGYHIVRK